MSESRGTSVAPLIRWGSLAAMLTGGVLIVKVAIVYATQGAESIAAASLYVAGMLLALLASAGVAAYVGRNRGRATRIGVYVLVVLGYVLFITTFSEGVEAAFIAVAGAPEYVAIEIPIALAGAVWLWFGYRIWTKTEEGHEPTSTQLA
jgi:hypothetical protein